MAWVGLGGSRRSAGGGSASSSLRQAGCDFVTVLIPASRNVGGIDVVLVFFRLVTCKALFGGVGHLRLLGISARPELKAPAAGRCIFLRVLHHHGQAFSGTFHVSAVGDGEVVQVGCEHGLVG